MTSDGTGCGAWLSGLRRTRIGSFLADNATGYGSIHSHLVGTEKSRSPNLPDMQVPAAWTICQIFGMPSSPSAALLTVCITDTRPSSKHCGDAVPCRVRTSSSPFIHPRNIIRPGTDPVLPEHHPGKTGAAGKTRRGSCGGGTVGMGSSVR